MKALVVYYSRTGTTRKLAGAITEKIDADKIEIKTKKNLQGLSGAIKSGWDSFAERKPVIEEIDRDLGEYDIVLIGSPIWAGNVSAPVRTFLLKYRDQMKKIAFFATFGASKAQKIFENMEILTGKRPETVLSIRKKKVEDENYEKEIVEYLETIENSFTGFKL